MDDTAMTSPDPALIKVIATKVRIRTPPASPRRRSAINGVIKPEETETILYAKFFEICHVLHASLCIMEDVCL